MGIPQWRVGGQVERSTQVRQSSTLQAPDWNNSTVLKADPADEVSRLKQELTGDILVLASFQLVHTLMEHDLVDELRLKVFPVVLGAGERLFRETNDQKPVRLLDSRTIDDGVTYLTYQRTRSVNTNSNRLAAPASG